MAGDLDVEDVLPALGRDGARLDAAEVAAALLEVLEDVVEGARVIVDAEDDRRGVGPGARRGEAGDHGVAHADLALVGDVLAGGAEVAGADRAAGDDGGAAMVLRGELPGQRGRAHVERGDAGVVGLEVVHAPEVVLRGDVDLLDVGGVARGVDQRQRLRDLPLAHDLEVGGGDGEDGRENRPVLERLVGDDGKIGPRARDLLDGGGHRLGAHQLGGEAELRARRHPPEAAFGAEEGHARRDLVEAASGVDRGEDRADRARGEGAATAFSRAWRWVPSAGGAKREVPVRSRARSCVSRARRSSVRSSSRSMSRS